jgi:uncharacterized protein with von Willebrand factor type A (vWA) domain
MIDANSNDWTVERTAIERTMSERVVAFGRALREVGLGVTTGQLTLFLDALAIVGITDPRAFHDAARASLVSHAEEIDAFEAVFARFWTRVASAGGRGRADQADQASHAAATPPPADRSATTKPRAPTQAFIQEAGVTRRSREPDAGPPVPTIDRRLTWSAADVLRRKRFDRLDPDEVQQVRALMRTLTWRIIERRTRRFRRASHGTHLDWRRMVQRAVRDQGEWIERRWRARRHAPRPLVVLADISGSMEAYSRLLLYFLHGLIQRRAAPRSSASRLRRDGRRRDVEASGARLAGPGWGEGSGARRTEAFVFATRLTRITRALRRRDVDAALAQVSTRVVDWSGGTRIGECLHVFNRDWARRVVGRGAVVLVISDAWDRGDPELFGREVSRLRKSSHRLIWLNPLIGTTNYEPRTRGLLAALPFIDDFLPAHDLASLEDLARHLERLPSTRGRRHERRDTSDRPPA